ncbi:MAG: metal-binding protein [Mogibacterium sp.]|nr:metal-binding protein [Mogibacterium sp.]
MKYSYRFFENRDCEYYPCHSGTDEINCLFCYCPLYHREDCPGSPEYKVRDGRTIKICSGCTFPHRPENYDKVIELIRK